MKSIRASKNMQQPMIMMLLAILLLIGLNCQSGVAFAVGRIDNIADAKQVYNNQKSQQDKQNEQDHKNNKNNKNELAETVLRDLFFSKSDDITPQVSEHSLIAFAKAYELIFFVSGHCRYCHQFADTVKGLADQLGLSVMTFSFDGKGVQSFQQVFPVIADQRSNYCQGYLQISQLAFQQCQLAQEIYKVYYGSAQPFTPVLFLQHKETMRFELLAKGVISREDLYGRLLAKRDQAEKSVYGGK
ncbi:conjugal transfer protein TraF [Cysteiniphilum halobium]|uniref:conjugal transfer protein TraF n=1 Tax=Cysteiniphilum halobium TaxID=2219059 RepID=UPI0013C359EB|nr:conjugal transfer protein TraF [Cysteiniphilum halobium]